MTTVMMHDIKAISYEQGQLSSGINTVRINITDKEGHHHEITCFLNIEVNANGIVKHKQGANR